MHIRSQFIRTGALMLCLLCSACAMQQQIDTNSSNLAQLSRLQAVTHSEIEKLRSEIQALSGTLEENSVVHNREIKNIQSRLADVTALLNGPSPDTNEGGLPLGIVSPETALDNEQVHYTHALELYRAHTYKESLAAFQAFLKRYPNSPLTHNAFFWVGMSLYQLADYRASISAFDDLMSKFPQGSKVPDAYYWQAMAFTELKEMLTAQILFETLMQTYPSSEASRKAKIKYSELNFQKNR